MFQVDVLPFAAFFRAAFFCIFFIDALTELNVGFYAKGKLMLNRRDILKHYIDGNGITDVIALLAVAIG